MDSELNNFDMDEAAKLILRKMDLKALLKA